MAYLLKLEQCQFHCTAVLGDRYFPNYLLTLCMAVVSHFNAIKVQKMWEGSKYTCLWYESKSLKCIL